MLSTLPSLNQLRPLKFVPDLFLSPIFKNIKKRLYYRNTDKIDSLILLWFDMIEFVDWANREWFFYWGVVLLVIALRIRESKRIPSTRAIIRVQEKKYGWILMLLRCLRLVLAQMEGLVPRPIREGRQIGFFYYPLPGGRGQPYPPDRLWLTSPRLGRLGDFRWTSWSDYDYSRRVWVSYQ